MTMLKVGLLFEGFMLSAFFKGLSIVPPAAGGVQQAENPKLEVTPVSDNSNGHHFTDSNFSPLCFAHLSLSHFGITALELFWSLQLGTALG